MEPLAVKDALGHEDQDQGSLQGFGEDAGVVLCLFAVLYRRIDVDPAIGPDQILGFAQ
jgi:hypothetical protein